MSKQKLTICYERLSRDDNDKSGESNSITNQKQMLQEYAERNDLAPFIHLSDDGQSGTNFSRPGWTELMMKVEAGEVGTILLKTLDRMGRDYLRTGLLLEQFKELGIRVIALGDNVDTSKGEDDFIPLRNLFAEWYARDCSRKINAVFQSRMSNGKRCSGAYPYGYLPNNGDINDLIIDEEAAAVIRRVFAMIIDGKGVNDIARTLMNEQVPIPSEHWKRIGQPSRSRKSADPYGWTPTTVSYIINNPVYKGTLVLGKTKNASYKSKKPIETAPEQQYVFENAMPVIIEPEVWENAQRLKKTVRKAPKCDETPNPLTGILYCGECNAKLSHRRSKNKDGYRENAYVCSRFRGVTRLCSLHYISSRNVTALILDSVQMVSKYALENEADFIAKVRERSALQQEQGVKENKKLLAKSQRRVTELDTLITRLYEDRVNGKIPEKHYDRMLTQYDAEQSELENKIAELQTAIDTFNNDSLRADRFIETAQRYTEFSELTPALLNEFISRVNVHEAVKVEGKRTQEVEIIFNFIGNFAVPEGFDILTPEERTAADERRSKLDKKNIYEGERRHKKKAEKIPA